MNFTSYIQTQHATEINSFTYQNIQKSFLVTTTSVVTKLDSFAVYEQLVFKT